NFLAVQRGGTYLDCTVGLGGHSYEIARRLGAPGRLIGLDKDPKALQIAQERLAVDRSSEPVVGRSSLVVSQDQDWTTVELMHTSFSDFANDERRRANNVFDGILADVGVSSLQFDDPARGFSFQAEGPLDMRMNPQAELTAEQVVNHF